MLQVVQYQKTGDILVEELPAPECMEGGVLVRNVCTLISPGTERTSVSNAQASLLARAKKQPEQVKMVLDNIKKEGLIATYKRVRSVLGSYKTLGYSSAGVVIESRCPEFSPGDRVACGGAGFAVHSEIVSVPKNLVCRIPDNVAFSEACYTTLGAISMQGVRQADLRLGETVAVVGLGLLGLIAIQLLKASGCKVIGLDINEGLFEYAQKFGCDAVFSSSLSNINNIIAQTNGIGCDAVLLTASTQSSEPMELATKIARKKGKIIVVGAVGMELKRSPFYEKELDITISCSYGPGRYDSNYEILGNDYPVAFVRWTENRNMQAILALMREGKLDVKSLTTHSYQVNEAPQAYNIITEGKELSFGVLLNYPHREEALNRYINVNHSKNAQDKIKIGFIGAGTFAKNYLLPPLKELGVEFTCVSTATATNAQSIAKQFGFQYASTDSIELINHKDVNVIFCATQHDTHSKFVLESLRASKPIFIEKPLAINREQLLEIDNAVRDNSGQVMLGFNRRFSMPFIKIAEYFQQRKEPMAINFRVNAGKLPIGHWVYRKEQGSGRIIGEACHFIDCMVFLTKALPVRVFCECISSESSEVFNRDTAIISIKLSDGSIGTIQYFANGNSKFSKEYCEVFCEEKIAIMDNYQFVKLISSSSEKTFKFDGSKGHKEEVFSTINALRQGKELPIAYSQIRAVTLATIAANESLDSGNSVTI